MTIIERPLFQRVTQCAPPPEPHKWGAGIYRLADPGAGRPHDVREWHCTRCPLMRITVLPKGANARREWRYGNGAAFMDVVTPECEAISTSPEISDKGCGT